MQSTRPRETVSEPAPAGRFLEEGVHRTVSLSKRSCSADHVMTVGTDSELEKFALAFAAGQLSQLFLIGNPGLGRSATRHSRAGWAL